MGLFDQAFQDHIQEELLSRTSRENIQNVLIPHVRVTSLVEGNLYGRPLHGFTLGNVDINKTPTIDDYFNTTGKGTAIGLTYTGAGNTAVQVKLNDAGNKKLPPPGVTNVSISTQSTGGFIFKATVQLKFYGKEQYDFIYQTMLRPGNPIVIEYGHTRMQENQKDLEFFQVLSQDLIDDFRSNLRNNVSLKSSRNAGRILGLVSNFRVRLNEQNEYEAEIELINSLEFLFTISPENTFLSYGSAGGAVERDEHGNELESSSGLRYLSKSIRSNFGWEAGEEFDPKFDNIFKEVLKDAVERPEDSEQTADEPTDAAAFRDWRTHILIPYETALGRVQAHELPGWAKGVSMFLSFITGMGPQQAGEIGEEKYILSSSMENSSAVYISLEYFLSKLLNNILDISFYDRQNGCNSSISADAFGTRNFRPTRDLPGGWGEWSSARAVQVRGERTAAAGTPDRIGADITEAIAIKLGESTSTAVELFEPIDSVGFWPNLRSVNIKNVIINNINLYNVAEDSADELHRPIPKEDIPKRIQYNQDQLSGYFFRTHFEAYTDRFGDGYENKAIFGLFKVNNEWKNKEVYEPSVTAPAGAQRTGFDGIFINYEKIRSAFIGSKSVGEAIQKVLNMVNGATADILKLKMRYMGSVEVTPAREIVRVNKIKIYDENALSGPEEQQITPYRFFEGNVSEAMSYNFDFSLPGSVAATVMANTFQPDELSAAGGDPEKKALISYGYALDSSDPPRLALRSLVNLDNVVESDKDKPIPHDHDYHEEEAEEGEDEEDLKTIKDMEQDAFYRQLLGYKELDPPKMKEKAIRSGLFNAIPSAGKINIKLQGLDGWRFGDMFGVHNVLPRPYDDNNIFMVTGYKHDINSQGWFTELDGTMIASIPENIKDIQAALRSEPSPSGGGAG